MKKIGQIALIAVCVLLVQGLFRPASAAVYRGCLTCVQDDYGVGLTQSWCHQVGDNETGDGTTCYETDYMGGSCATSGNPCYNVVVNGGGAGSTGGSQGSECNAGPGGYCPPSCGSCNRTP